MAKTVKQPSARKEPPPSSTKKRTKKKAEQGDQPRLSNQQDYQGGNILEWAKRNGRRGPGWWPEEGTALTVVKHNNPVVTAVLDAAETKLRTKGVFFRVNLQVTTQVALYTHFPNIAELKYFLQTRCKSPHL